MKLNFVLSSNGLTKMSVSTKCVMYVPLKSVEKMSVSTICVMYVPLKSVE
jgi:hypothetical protein